MKLRSRAYRFGPFYLDVTERRLLRDGEVVVLAPRAFDVLTVLVEHGRSLVTKEELMQRVWTGTVVEQANIAVTIATLRRALGRELIETVPKHGYRLNAAVDAIDTVPIHAPQGPVEIASDGPSAPPVEKIRSDVSSAPAQIGNNDRAEEIAAAARPARWLSRHGAVGLLGLALGIVLVIGWLRDSRGGDPKAKMPGELAVERLTDSYYVDSHVSARGDGRLVFTSERDGNPEIYTVDPDGRNARRVTTHPGRDEFPAWSPDGTLIAFASDRGGNGLQIHVMAADGTGVRAITSLPLACTEPSWSPDGTRIAFHRDDAREIGQDIYTVAIDGTDVRQLTFHRRSDVAPAWSPDGKTIAFASNRDEGSDFDLFVVDAGGGEPRRITSGPGGDVEPAWSPDGEELAFCSNRAGGFSELHIVRVDGGATRRVLRGEAEHPVWAPDGASIFFTSRAPGNAELSRVHLNSAVAIAPHDAEDEFGAWSPDGSSIAFSSNRDGKRAIFLLDVASGRITKLTDGKANDRFPSWAPDGQRIVFQSDRVSAGGEDLCVLDIKEDAARCITSGYGTKGSPAWSPDGSRIAFQSNMDGRPYEYRIYTVAPDGSALTPLTSGAAYDGDPAWSPDSSRLAFARKGIGEPHFEVFTMRRDGTDLTPLTRTEEGASKPAWSPDGRWIAYTRLRRGQRDLFAIPAEGGSPLRITYGSGQWPRWSPNGDRLLFTSQRFGTADLMVIRVPDELAPRGASARESPVVMRTSARTNGAHRGLMPRHQRGTIVVSFLAAPGRSAR